MNFPCQSCTELSQADRFEKASSCRKSSNNECNLDNDQLIDSSFSARMGNTFVVSESGKGFMNFGIEKAARWYGY